MDDSGLVRAVEVLPFERVIEYVNMNFSAYVVGLKLVLEDGRSFVLVNIPHEVAEAIRVFNNGQTPPRRQSIFSLLLSHEEFKEALGRALKRVIIDELDYETSLYTATVEFEEEGITLRVKMIPSHAIYMALIAGKPIYVKEELVEESEEDIEDLGLDDDLEE
ncbi:MAG: DUF151 domain-containing protein [Desulfurococcales archaeon]|nr:DUF151 domain-containing protein [Desulfurococcales archaeon]